MIDHVSKTIPLSSGQGRLIILEDNDAVLTMVRKSRAPLLRHVTRTHRVDLDWCLERLREDDGIYMRYINTKQQIADMLTKGSFSAHQWNALLSLANLGYFASEVQKPKHRHLTPNKPIHPHTQPQTNHSTRRDAAIKKKNITLKTHPIKSVANKALCIKACSYLFAQLVPPLRSRLQQRTMNLASTSRKKVLTCLVPQPQLPNISYNAKHDMVYDIAQRQFTFTLHGQHF